MRRAAVIAILAAVGCGGDDGASVDAAAIDAAAVDSQIAACAGDHAERIERENDPALGGTIEVTGLTVTAGGAASALCGELSGAEGDADFYAVAVEGEAEVPVRVELRAPDAADADVVLSVWGVTGSGRVFLVATARLLGPVAVAVTPALPPGTYAVSVASSVAVDAPLPYEIAIAENTAVCDAATGAPDHDESGDGGDNRGNDAVQVSFTPIAEFAPTARSGDDAEATGLTLSPGTTTLVAGESAARVSAGDAYRDRDAYELTTAANTAELELRLTWAHAPDAPDLDMYLFRAGEAEPELSLGAGSFVGQFDEVVTLRVDPGAAYWVWVGAFDELDVSPEAAAYELTICAR